MIDRNEPQSRENLVKVSFPLKPGEWPGLEAENMWAEPLKSGKYRVVNIPFYVYGVSAEDVVDATSIDGVLSFTRVAERGGHSTYRLLLEDGIGITDSRFISHWIPLESMGCSFEGANSRWLAVDVPPQTDIYEVYSQLENGQNHGVWSFDEGHCGHPVAKRNGEN